MRRETRGFLRRSRGRSRSCSGGSGAGATSRCSSCWLRSSRLFYAISLVKLAKPDLGALVRRGSMQPPRRPRSNAVAGGRPVRHCRSAWSGMSFAAVPLYKMFCAVTGYGGTPQIGPAASPGISGKTIAVRFNADTNPGAAVALPARPDGGSPQAGRGAGGVLLRAQRGGHARDWDRRLQRHAGRRSGKYFHKTACFCFNQQTLAPKQQMEFPVSFWVDPGDRGRSEHGRRENDHAFLHVLPHARTTRREPARWQMRVRMSAHW